MIILILLFLLVFRVYHVSNGPDLEKWHTFVPNEIKKSELERLSWDDYIENEKKISNEIKLEVVNKLSFENKSLLNRYNMEGKIYPGNFKIDWNQSYILYPTGKPKGAAVFLHGLTDTPYSLRHIALDYQNKGYVAIGIRLPGHGTVPGGLTDVEWEDWLAATKLAIRKASSTISPDQPLHIIGFSNGGALAIKYTLDSLSEPDLFKPSRVILISPMIGVTSFARFAGVAGWPAFFPAFAKTAWLGVVPEFNPFKYNSFPVNAARQSYLLTTAIQEQIASYEKNGILDDLPPILTFQSVVDSTVSTQSIITALYNKLPLNNSQLVLFDINHASDLEVLLRTSSYTAVERLLPPAPRNYTVTVVTNKSKLDNETVALTVKAGSINELYDNIGLYYPSDLFSLSHVALPFPETDSLYGGNPELDDRYGVHLGTISARGERSVLMVGLDSLMRASFNPFYPYMLKRINDNMN